MAADTAGVDLGRSVDLLRIVETGAPLGAAARVDLIARSGRDRRVGVDLARIVGAGARRKAAKARGIVDIDLARSVKAARAGSIEAGVMLLLLGCIHIHAARAAEQARIVDLAVGIDLATGLIAGLGVEGLVAAEVAMTAAGIAAAEVAAAAIAGVDVQLLLGIVGIGAILHVELAAAKVAETAGIVAAIVVVEVAAADAAAVIGCAIAVAIDDVQRLGEADAAGNVAAADRAAIVAADIAGGIVADIATGVAGVVQIGTERVHAGRAAFIHLADVVRIDARNAVTGQV